MKADKKFDSLLLGLILGIVVPVITLMIVWAVKYKGGLGSFLVEFQQMGLLSKMVSLSVIPNLLLFFIFTWLNRSFSARGVIFATFILAFIMLILKFA